MHAWAVYKQLTEGKDGRMVHPDVLEAPIVRVNADCFNLNILEPLPHVYSEPGMGVAVGLKPIQSLTKKELWDYLCNTGYCCHVCGEPLDNSHICFNVQSNL